MEILVTICARQGSKGLRNKNIKPLVGKPLIAYTIEQALKWPRASEVVVSTDSAKIAEAAKRYGAQVPFLRPRELAQDGTPKIEAVRHALTEAERFFRKRYDLVVDLDATAPLRRTADIERCYQKFMERRPLTLFSVVRARHNPYFNMVEEDARGFVKLSKSSSNGVHRRQDAPAVYDMNASIYLYEPRFFRNKANQSPISGRSVAYVMDELSGVDIDSEIDFKFVEFLLRKGLFKP